MSRRGEYRRSPGLSIRPWSYGWRSRRGISRLFRRPSSRPRRPSAARRCPPACRSRPPRRPARACSRVWASTCPVMKTIGSSCAVALQRPLQLEAVHARHPDVEHEAGGTPGLASRRNACGALVDLDRVARGGDRAAQGLAHRRVVVHHEDVRLLRHPSPDRARHGDPDRLTKPMVAGGSRGTLVSCRVRRPSPSIRPGRESVRNKRRNETAATPNRARRWGGAVLVTVAATVAWWLSAGRAAVEPEATAIAIPEGARFRADGPRRRPARRRPRRDGLDPRRRVLDGRPGPARPASTAATTRCPTRGRSTACPWTASGWTPPRSPTRSSRAS